MNGGSKKFSLAATKPSARKGTVSTDGAEYPAFVLESSIKK